MNGQEPLSHVTISDVARRAGVSSMTVSRVVNGRPNVAEETRARVLAAIHELGYVPSAQARGLAVGRSNVIGIVVPGIVSEWALPLIMGAAQAAEALGYQVLLRTTGLGAAQSGDTQVMLGRTSLIDGMILASWAISTPFRRKLARRVPVVVVDGYERADDVMWVGAADRAGVREAARHLLELGHRRIAFLGGGGSYLGEQRLAGYLDALAAVAMEPDEALIVQGDFTRESGYRLGRVLLTRERRPTAVLCASDPMALGVLQAVHELGLSVPDQLSLVGCDDTLAAQASPPLTTVRRPYAEMGAAALRLLIESLERSPNGKPPQLDLPAALVVRASTGPPW